MGVKPFVEILKTHGPSGLIWDFKQFEQENHNSVSMPAIRWSLEQIFKGWEVGRGEIHNFKDAKVLSAHYQKFSKKLGYDVKISYMTIYVAISTYYRNKSFKEIEILGQEIAQHFPASTSDFLVYAGVIYSSSGEHEKPYSIWRNTPENFPFQLLVSIVWVMRSRLRAIWKKLRSISKRRRNWQGSMVTGTGTFMHPIGSVFKNNPGYCKGQNERKVF